MDNYQVIILIKYYIIGARAQVTFIFVRHTTSTVNSKCLLPNTADNNGLPMLILTI